MRQQLQVALKDFLWHFELVFDSDWQHTREVLRDPRHYISESGTFLHPAVEDESNNWGNRGGLLDAYRRLKSLFDASETGKS